jgi:hypothetical protein
VRTQTLRPGNPHAWRVFSFNSRNCRHSD